ncbi:hypothetical protein GWO43_15600, partial [candidate division KSB1 bacterium]|nr:hypothetical protein [candidate division KSB1 bacterium]NIR68439.1 hypothetical protein [candidate division KSB1 bacterium]NIS25391.1 hypothetical protein [candidate division KSB1 bacterium]NIT72268.1 hypothetical protein [candidate division KSB1 bacterium]NIU26073.1 hypothetical protein [candidate division KSB1 bacterium]
MAIRLKIRSPLPWLLTGLLVSACGNRNYKVGTEYLENGYYASAIEQLKLAEREDPSDWKIKRELGIAYYKNEQYEQAIAKLSQANSMQSKDGKAFLYLGLSYESNRNFSKATSIFKSYASQDIEPRLRTELHARIRDMTKKQFRMDIRERLTSLERGKPIKTEPNTVAVLYFRNLSQWEELTPILKGVAELITAELGKVQNLRMI